ncbi:MAG: hypothetical protein LBM28_07320 [Oscillospiraceae bacterium]|jgi:hypothetical protein|nr:hypothetical protein [Oscillospiraceae bacterium]
MKIWIAAVGLVLLLAFAGGLPFSNHETQKLLPLHTVQVELTEDGVHIVSEAGEGYGATWSEAVRALHESASGEVFFDTAEQLVLCSRAINIVPEILEEKTLRPAAQVYRSRELQPVEGLNEYLSSQESDVSLGDLLAAQEEGMRLQPPLLVQTKSGPEVRQ